ncbi:PhzF family phenazine biosynthesis protein [Telmatobacter bradus]|uniref:PhzF family phenazine biosynthesis protein n=1 Tax=Telmatobacter bradus TaxID=474953 RepID=UPI003B42FF62
MKIPLYQVDAFTTKLFRGNPAAVMLLDSCLPDATLLAIAAENNLSETAFLMQLDEINYLLRWFTPRTEVPLCGHATLASAAVVMERLEPQRREVRFQTLSGILTVKRCGDGYAMDFPAPGVGQVSLPDGVREALGTEVLEVWRNASYLLVLLKDAATVRALKPDFAGVAKLDPHGVIVTAAGEDGYDCVSRFFAPNYGVPEDPVTGSAHCVLTPFWAARLGRKGLRAYQASARGGEILCTLQGDRVELAGSCVFYLEGAVEVS